MLCREACGRESIIVDFLSAWFDIFNCLVEHVGEMKLSVGH
jgi:hypothetical protein